eukprot:c28324_g1_i2.p1 GENE.c28324_g1_i2~~c28324_g1_i2.p1  ORF type:complete len:125 (+),score=33.58 c28324_g1_i2:21-395(+)
MEKRRENEPFVYEPYGDGPNSINGRKWAWKANLELNAALHWDKFYKSHQSSFFKDRHYLHREFPELLIESETPLKLVEIGCGVGNTVFPLLEVNPNLFVYACDFSETAIELVKKNELYESTKII